MYDKTIPDGYKILIVAPNGDVIDSVDIGGMNLDLPIARSEFVNEVASVLERNKVGNDSA